MESKIYALMDYNRIYNDYELAQLTQLPLPEVRRDLSRLVRCMLIDLTIKIKVGRKVYRGYKSKQKQLFYLGAL